MAKDFHEKDYDDEVYEDDYYEEHYEEEELQDESEILEEEEETERVVDEEAEGEAEADEEVEELGWDEQDQKKVTVSYACEECDYRWDDVIIKKKDITEEDEPDIICPMCGSMNVTLI